MNNIQQIVDHNCTNNKTAVGFHFWIVLTMLFFLIVIYLSWPWQTVSIEDNLRKYIPWLSSIGRLAVWESQHKVFGILFVIPIIYIIVFFRWQGIVNILCLTVAGLSPIILGFSIGLSSQWLSYTFLLLLPSTIGGIFNLEMELRRRDKEFLVQRESERQTYISKIFEAQEKERKCIAQEIHDELLQTLTAITRFLESINSTDISDIEKERIVGLIRNSVLEVTNNLRQISLSLRPRLLDELGLVAALNWQVNVLNAEGNINYKLIVNGIERRLPTATELLLYRTVQEALNNVKKHSRADTAVIKVDFTDKNIKIVIKDNGIGLSANLTHKQLAVNGKMGLLDMQERVSSLGGKINIQSRPNNGTTISILVPLVN